MTRSAEVQERITAFEEGLLSWLEQARPGVPIFTLPDAPSPKAGACISCGDPIPTGWRCAPCLEAVHRVIKETAR